MIQSMTGYGKAVREISGNLVTAEIKSVNSKSLEMGLRLPAAYRDKEQELKTFLSQELERGKIDVTIAFDNGLESKKGSINKKIVKEYISDIKAIERELSLPKTGYLQLALALPNAISAEKPELKAKEWKQLDQLIHKAVKEFRSFRFNEGKALEKDLLLRVKNIYQHLHEIERYEPQRLINIRTRLSKMLSGSDDSSIDKNRFEQELIYYLEKIDITEEKVRLKSHCDYFLNTIKEKTSNGKKLGFIIQEIGREINTIGSKANDANIQRHVVEMKDELEKMKEQVANVL